MLENEENVVKAPLDMEHLRRFTLGDTDLEEEILGLFISHAPETLASLRAADGPVEWRAAAHGLKGSARAVGAHTVAELASIAERGYPDGEAEKLQQLAGLVAAVEDVRDYIARLQASAMPGKA